MTPFASQLTADFKLAVNLEKNAHDPRASVKSAESVGIESCGAVMDEQIAQIQFDKLFVRTLQDAQIKYPRSNEYCKIHF